MNTTTVDVRTQHWNLWAVAATQGIGTAGELADRLRREAGYEISAAHLTRYLKKQPPGLRVEFLTALCTVLKIDTGDLFSTSIEQREIPVVNSPPKVAQRRRLRDELRRPGHLQGR